MLKIKQFTFNYFGENTLLVIDPETRDAIVVDPGMFTPRERKEFDDFVAANNLKINQVVNTHMHLDHCFGDNYVRDRYGVKVAAHVADAPLGAAIAEQGLRFGLGNRAENVELDVELHDGDTIHVGNGTLKVIHVPGHSPGGIALYDEADGWVIVGDSLFQGSIGRTDLEGGNYSQLVRAVTDRLLSLPDNTQVVPGHGPRTTVGEERRSNPYL